jgi:predicted site-specific integrase-resolvase
MHHGHAMTQTKATELSPFIGTKEACRYLDVDKSTLTRWVAKGVLTPAFRASNAANSAMIFRREDIEALAA